MRTKIGLILCGLLCAAGPLSAFTPSWNDNVVLKRDLSRKTYWMKSRDNKAFYGSISGIRGVDFNKIKTWIREGRLHVDLSNGVFLRENGFVDIGFRVPLDRVDRTLPTCFAMDIDGAPGLSGDIGMNGEYLDKKHYWNNKPFLLTGEKGDTGYEVMIPQNVRVVHLIARMRTPGVYTFGRSSAQSKKSDEIDPKKNLIVNGGAERNWYSSGVRNMLNCTAEKEYSPFWGKNIYRYPLIAEIDPTEKVSGKASFKFTVRHDKPRIASDSHYTMHFNQVPVVRGKSALLTLWMKSDKPERKALIRLHYGPGGGFYGLNASVGPQWKKYQIKVPKMGEKPVIGWLSGNFNNHIYKLVTPRIEFQTPGTYWIDNAAFFVADKGEYSDEPLNIAGTLNKDSTYYFTGEPISTTLTVSSADPQKKSVELSWSLYDFFGKKVASAPGKTLPLRNGKAVTDVPLTPPSNLRGALNWELVADGVVHNYYLGIIDRSKTACPRLGVNLAQHNVEIGRRYLKDFRYSSVRIWYRNGMIPGDNLIEPYHRNGFYTLFCINRMNGAYRYLFPKDAGPWKKILRETASKYKGMVNAYEIINEPNALAGMGKNPDPEKYEHITPETNAKIIRIAAETIRPIDPDAKFAGPTTCHTDVSWTSNVLANGAAKYLDIITEHPYLTLPELPDYTQMLFAMRSETEKFGKKFQFFATERGTMIPANPADNRFNDQCRRATANILRTQILGYAGGSGKFFDFLFCTGNYATTYNMVFSGNPDNHYLPKPGYGMYAAKALADRIENAPMVKQVKLGLVFRCYLFDHGSKRTAVIWKWRGRPETITFNRDFQLYDFMGTGRVGKAVELSEYPCYVETTLSAEEFAREIVSADLKNSGDPIQVSLNVKNARQFALDIRNIIGRKLSAGTVRILSENLTEQKSLPIPAIAPESKTEVVFNTLRPIGLNPVPLKAEINGKVMEFQLKGLTATHIEKDPVIDGDLRDWEKIPAIRLDGMKDGFPYTDWTPEEKQSKAELRFAWNTKGFYLAVTVWKKGFHPVDSNGTGATWRGDGLQIAMDTLKNAMPGSSGYQDDDFEYDVALYKNRPLVNRTYGSLAIHDSLSKKIGPVEDVQCAIAVHPEKVVYELKFLPFAVSPFRLLAGESMRISVIVNMNNGKERIGYLQLTPGLGVAKKKPSQFIDIFLER